MLTASQVAITAYLDSAAGEFLCVDCARERYGELRISRVDAGLDDDPYPYSRFALQEIAAEDAYGCKCPCCEGHPVHCAVCCEELD